MGLGDFISKAYDVGVGYDRAYDRQRDLYAKQQQTEQLARNEAIRQVELERMKAMRAQEAAPAPQVGQYDIAGVPTMPVLPVPEAQTMPQPVGPTPAGAAQTMPQPTGPTPPGAAQTMPQPTQSEVARFQALTPAQKMAELKRINAERQVGADRGELLHYPARALDVFAGPINATLGVLEKGANAIGVPRLGKALGIYDPEVTSVEIPKIGNGSIEPYFNEFVRKPYEAAKPLDEAGYLKLLQERDAKAPKAAPQAAPQTGTPTKRGSQYDAAKTPFDPLIAQAAQQNGIDPTVFKRLIGSESSFQAAPKPPTDSKGPIAFGIAQIHRMHIQNGSITMEQAMNPATALPFAAKLFAGYLQRANGDYGVALQMYKGASSDKGKAAMAGPINDVLAGTPYAVAPAELKARDQSPALALVSGSPGTPGLAATRKMKPSDFYLGGGEAGQDRITVDAQMMQAQYQANRQLALDDYRALIALGDVRGARQIAAQISQLDGGYKTGMVLLEGMDAIRKFEAFNDPRYLTAILQKHTGITYQFQPYEDGDFEVIAVAPNGQQSRKGKYSMTKVADFAREKYDTAYREQKIAAQRALAESQAKAAGDLAKEEVNGLYNLKKAFIEGNFNLAKEAAQASQFDVRADGNGGMIAFRKDGSVLGTIEPGGTIKDSEGREIKQPPKFRQASGL